MNKAIWGVLGVLIIIGFGVFLLNKNSQVAVPTVPAATEIPTTITSTDSAAPSTTESIVVTYFDSGFSPTTFKPASSIIVLYSLLNSYLCLWRSEITAFL